MIIIQHGIFFEPIVICRDGVHQIEMERDLKEGHTRKCQKDNSDGDLLLSATREPDWNPVSKWSAAIVAAIAAGQSQMGFPPPKKHCNGIDPQQLGRAQIETILAARI